MFFINLIDILIKFNHHSCMENFKSQNVIDALLTKICHDLINPLGSAQMALEENEEEYLQNSVKEAILKVDMYRFLYRGTVDAELQDKKFNNFISETNFTITINHTHKKISPLLFFFSQKMLDKSSIVINKEDIILNYFFLNEKEIKGINGVFDHIDTSNILLYLAHLQYNLYYNTNIENLENNKWRIQIKNK